MKKELSNNFIQQSKKFWRWFDKNKTLIEECIDNKAFNEVISFEFFDKLAKVSTRFGFNLVHEKDRGNYFSLTITVDGQRKLYPKVDHFISLAPVYENWKFIALIQPVTDFTKIIAEEDEPIIFEDFSYHISDLFFTPTNFDTIKKVMDIMVYLPNYRFYFDHEFLEQSIELIVLDLIGEDNYFKNISSVKLGQLPDNTSNLIPLYQLNDNINFLMNINRRTKIDIS